MDEKEEIMETKVAGNDRVFKINRALHNRMKIICIKLCTDESEPKLYELYEEAVEAWVVKKEAELIKKNGLELSGR